MKYIKTLSHQKLSFLLALYIGIFLNLSVFYRRFDDYFFHATTLKWVSAVAEVIAAFLLPFFLMRLFSLAGRRLWQMLATLTVLCSVAASYYMTVMHVVIGYGIIASVMTTDIDLSKEVIGRDFVIWMVMVSAVPLYLVWRNKPHKTLIEQLRTPGERLRSVGILLLSVALVWAPMRYLDGAFKHADNKASVDMPSYGGVVANSYLPSNWLAALGLFTWANIAESTKNNSLFDPAKKFTYVAPASLDDTYVVFIIGETTRWDHMGLLGYDRDTTPKLSKEKNLVAFRGTSCDTATKLSLRCMFVREGGTSDNPQRTLKEQNVFAVLKQLGFSSELFAMQSEVWFYKNTMASNIAYREQIAAEPRNEGKPVDDMLLLPEVQQSLDSHPDGKHLIILHTKGSHFSYIERYPRSFARYQPECMGGVDDACSKKQLINAFDNTVLYTDTVIDSVIDKLRNKKAIVFYAADHGESINEKERLHGTPRKMAPPEQFRVPLLMWMSDSYLQDPQHKAAFEHLQAQQRIGVPHRHVELYDTILGCLGYTSPNGGINENNNWCHVPNAQTHAQ